MCNICHICVTFVEFCFAVITRNIQKHLVFLTSFKDHHGKSQLLVGKSMCKKCHFSMPAFTYTDAYNTYILYVHMHVRRYMLCKCAHIHAHTHTRVYIYKCVFVHACICIYIYIHTYAYLYLCTGTFFLMFCI